jgi:quinohemoprotein ethanol dehydrogenase
MVRARVVVTVIYCLCCAAGCNPRPPAAGPSAAAPVTPRGAVDAARMANAAHEADQWLANGRDAGGSYFSPLTGINKDNVKGLGFAWNYKLGTKRGLEATPLVVDGVMYAVGAFGWVYSLDAATGRELWKYDPKSDGQWGRYACCDAVNRGLAVWKGKVYVGALDGHLHAIDATTGTQLWKVDTLIGRTERLPYTITGAPVIAGDVVVIGNSGSDFKGVRGYVSAYELDTGRLKWRFFTVPRDPRLGPQDQPHLVDAIRTWDPRHRWEFGGGGNAWDGMSYDPDLRLVYIGTANASPYSIKEGGRRGGDDLYAASIIAIHADSGQLAWYYQAVPGDEWDYDSTQKMILADLDIGSRTRKVLMQASKNGFFYVLDRATGELISASNFAYVNWTRGIDPKTGRPLPAPDTDYMHSPRLLYPSMAGAHSWNPMSFNPKTGLVYIPAIEAPMVFIETSKRPAGLIEGNFTVAGVPPEDYDPASLRSIYGSLPALSKLSPKAPAGAPHSVTVLKAWDPIHQRLVWQGPPMGFRNGGGGVLSTAGDIVVQGNAAGMLTVFDATSGSLIANIDVGTSIIAAPMTYRINGEQFVAVMAGFGGGVGLYWSFEPGTAAFKYGNEGRIVAFKLGGGAVPKPPAVTDTPFDKPPPREGTRANVARGEILYNRFCGRCHTMGRGELPDLRRLSPATQAIFYEIVLNGVYIPRGMGRFDDVLSRGDAQDLHAFLIDQAWTAYAQQSTGH